MLTAVDAKNAFKSYFKILESLGYSKDSNVRRLLAVLLFLDFTNTDLSWFVTDKDYKLISKVYRMLSGDCLIPYKMFCGSRIKVGSPVLNVGGKGLGRFTQTGIQRYAEDEIGNGMRQVEDRTWMDDNRI